MEAGQTILVGQQTQNRQHHHQMNTPATYYITSSATYTDMENYQNLFNSTPKYMFYSDIAQLEVWRVLDCVY